MSTGPRCSPPSHPTRSGSACAWLARWLLVLLLAVDLIGAPLHAHAHDSGVDGHAWAPHVDAPGWAAVPADDTDDPLQLRHATLTLTASIDAPYMDPGDGTAGLVLGWWPPFGAAGAFAPAIDAAQPGASWPPPPPRPEYRSRPPAGRAPPPRA